jgi:hypothetical protein
MRPDLPTERNHLPQIIDVGFAKVPVYAAKVDVYDAKVDVYKFSSTILPSRLHTKHKTLNSNRMK